MRVPAKHAAAQGRRCRKPRRTRSGPSRSRPSTAWSTAPMARASCRTRLRRYSSCRPTAARRASSPRAPGTTTTSPGRPTAAEILVSANRHENADLEPADSEVYAVDVATGAIRALTKSLRSRRAACRVAGRQVRRLYGLRRPLPGLPARAPVPAAPRQRRGPRARRRPRPRHPDPDLEPRRPAHLLPVRRPGHDAHRRVRPLRAGHEPRRRPRRRRLVAALWRRLVQRRARRHDRLQRERRPRSRAAVGIYDGGKSRRLTKLNDGSLRAARARQGRGDLEHDPGRRAPRAELADPPAGLRPVEDIPADPRDPRRPVRQLRAAFRRGAAALCRRRLQRALLQPARQHELRRGVRQPDPPRLPGARLRRPDGRGRRGDRARRRRPATACSSPAAAAAAC